MEKPRCVACSRDFVNQAALDQHNQVTHNEAPRIQAKQSPKIWLVASVLIVVVGLGAAAFLWGTADISGAATSDLTHSGDHWHSDYSISICGQKLADAPYSEGDIHTHGDGKIHIHPNSEFTAGKSANLKNFFSSISVILDENSIKVGTRTFSDCDGEPATTNVLVNGVRIERPNTYIPQEEDDIEVVFD